MGGRRVLITGVANPSGARLARLLAADAWIELLELADDVRARIQQKVYESVVDGETIRA